MSYVIQFRRDTSVNWTATNPVLAQGELGLETDTTKYKIGNGTTAWNSLSYGSLSGNVSGLGFNNTTDPSAPSSGLTMYAKGMAGRVLPRIVGPAGIPTFLQPFLARNKIGYWCPPGNATTVPGVLGYTAPTLVGTATSRSVSTSNLFTRMRRLGLVSTAVAGALASYRVAAAQVTLGNGGGMGGFHKIIRFGISDAVLVSGSRMFMGVSATTTAPTNVEPSTLVNSIGVGHGASGGNLKLYYGGSTAQTPIDLGTNFPISNVNADVYELALFSPPNLNGVIYWEVTRINTGHVATGTIDSGGNHIILPSNTTLLSYAWGYRTNNASSLAVGLDIMSDYIETDN